MKKLRLMFRWTFVFVLLGMLHVHANVYPQNGQQVKLSMKEASLKDVLWAIESQTSFVFMYNEEDLDKIGKVNVDVQGNDIRTILNACLKNTDLTYVLQDEVIVLKPAIPQKTVKELVLKGKVVDERKEPLPGVTILVKGTTVGAVTDANGQFTMTVPEAANLALVFSFIGMEPVEVVYKGQKEFYVVMKSAKEELEEVVVTGYTKLRKESFTGNATTVTKDQLLKTNNNSVIEALQTFDPSFRIKENSIWGSDPNALPEFTIRGESSIAVNKGLDYEQQRREQRTNLKDNPNLPIFIMDGFEVDVQKIYDMDINRIQSMTILKDAAATAMYGSRAANGVVVVTTVAPKPGELRVTYNFSGGAELPDLSDYNLCNAREKLDVEVFAGKYKAESESQQIYKDEEYNNALNQILRGANTDWLAQPLRNVFNHKHSLNVQGGVESVRYGIDLSYDSNNGAMKGSYRSRYGAGLTLDFRKKEWLQIMNQISYNSTRMEDSPYGTFSDYAALQPYFMPRDMNGELVPVFSDGKSNPLWKVANLYNFTGKGYLNDLTENFSINLFFFKGFSFKGQFSITKTDSQTETFVDPSDPSFAGAPDREKGSLLRSTSKDYRWNVNAMFYYNQALGKHFINATLGLNASENESENTALSFRGFPLGSLNKPSYAAEEAQKAMVSPSKKRLVGFLGSVNYSYNDIYLFDASFRLDGSSSYGEDKRFAPFWSVGAGLNIHNYAMFKDSWWLNTLRIRGTYGVTGNANFPDYAAVTKFKTSTDSWYYTGPANSLIFLGNPQLTWEKTKTVDLGINLGLFEDRLYIEANYYHKQTEDQIYSRDVRPSSGFTTFYSNAGTILNEGFEINMNATLFRNKDWTVSMNANLAANKNTIKRLGAEMEAYNKAIKDNYENKMSSYPEELRQEPVIQYYEGASTTSIYAVRSLGIDPANGREKFLKKNGSTTYTWCAEDMVVCGDENPDAQGSFGLNVAWKGFYVNASFMYQWGGQAYNETLLRKVENADVIGSNVDRRVLTECWKQAGDVSPYYDLKKNTQTSPTSRFVQDLNVLNFSSLSCGYDFQYSMIKKIRLNSLGIRFNANDLCRWSTVKEERGTSYPYSKNYSITLTLGF